MDSNQFSVGQPNLQAGLLEYVASGIQPGRPVLAGRTPGDKPLANFVARLATAGRGSMAMRAHTFRFQNHKIFE